MFAQPPSEDSQQSTQSNSQTQPNTQPSVARPNNIRSASAQAKQPSGTQSASAQAKQPNKQQSDYVNSYQPPTQAKSVANSADNSQPLADAASKTQSDLDKLKRWAQQLQQQSDDGQPTKPTTYSKPDKPNLNQPITAQGRVSNSDQSGPQSVKSMKQPPSIKGDDGTKGDDKTGVSTQEKTQKKTVDYRAALQTQQSQAPTQPGSTQIQQPTVDQVKQWSQSGSAPPAQTQPVSPISISNQLGSDADQLGTERKNTYTQLTSQPAAQGGQQGNIMPTDSTNTASQAATTNQPAQTADRNSSVQSQSNSTPAQSATRDNTIASTVNTATSTADTAATGANTVAPDKTESSERLEDQNIFVLLGVADGSEEEKEQFLDELQQVIWEDFVENDLELLVTSSEKKDIDQILSNPDLSEADKQEQVIMYLEELIPDLEEIMLEKALELKEEMVQERIAGMKKFYQGDQAAIKTINRAIAFLAQNKWHSGAEILNTVE